MANEVTSESQQKIDNDKLTSMTTDEMRAARERGESQSNWSQKHDYVWDEQDEDDRPLTDEEIQAGLAAYRQLKG